MELLLLGLLCHVLALENGLGRLPQMGYNSWYDVQMNPTQDQIKATVQAMKQNGLHAAGYKYINLDDGIIAKRDNHGILQPDPAQFPNGFKYLADYLHANGFLFGVYTDRGPKTCGGRPAAFGHESIDAQTYAIWGVDYVKEDSCNAEQDHQTAFHEYSLMRDALNATGRPIFFSLCGWEPWYAPVGKSLGNSWRTGPDDTNWGGVLKDIDYNAPLWLYAGPGGWNDPCLLLGTVQPNGIGITELQVVAVSGSLPSCSSGLGHQMNLPLDSASPSPALKFQGRFQFSMWAIMASPLLLSQNVRNLSDYQLQTYLNKEVIAVNQDPLGRQGQRLVGTDLSSPQVGKINTNIWGRPLASGAWAIAFINADKTQSTTLTCDANCLQVTQWDANQKFRVRDLWAGKELSSSTVQAGVRGPMLPANGGVGLYLITPYF